ncbi:MAG: metal ABC transporter substrate-binding protein [Myxococcales bacterium]|nr:metal ABC transporter substrate-binding protein [Myxococcales bacterium]
MIRAFSFASFVAFLLSCSPPSEAPAPEAATPSSQLRVFVVNEPLRYFAARIGGSHVEVVLPAPSGIDPSTWTPDAETVAAYQSADLVLRSGAGYADWVDLVSLPAARVVDTSAAYRQRVRQRAGTVTHQHGPGGEHSHGELAHTTWLDLQLAILQAAAVADTLVRARPEHESAFRSELAALVADLEALDGQLAAAAQELADAPLLFSHPVYDYLIGRYALNARSLDWEPDAPPTPRQWRDLAAVVHEHPARWLLWEAEPLTEIERALRERGIESVVFDPCGGTPEDGDFLGVMKANVARFEAASTASE